MTDTSNQVIIAIDGPAGSGKSSTARAVSRELGFVYLDTGAMYRAVGLALKRAGIETNPESVASLVDDSSISLAPSDDGCRVSLNGEDVTELLRTPEVAEAASIVARVPAVRTSMVLKQRSIAAAAVEQFGGAVLEGRDIGTVVFPDAELKIFLEADLGERARRRVLDLSAEGVTANDVQEQLHRRDVADQTRDIAPLKVADDAIRIDTTNLTFEQQVSQIVGLAQRIIH